MRPPKVVMFSVRADDWYSKATISASMMVPYGSAERFTIDVGVPVGNGRVYREVQQTKSTQHVEKKVR